MHLFSSSALVRFIHSDSGAVTVDWVVMTAAGVGLGLATMSVVSGGVENLAMAIDTQLVNTPIVTSFASLFEAPGTPLFGGHQGAGGGFNGTYADRYDMYVANALDGDPSDVVFSATEALGISESGAPDAYQLDNAAIAIQALAEAGEDTTALEARYQAELARYMAANPT